MLSTERKKSECLRTNYTISHACIVGIGVSKGAEGSGSGSGGSDAGGSGSGAGGSGSGADELQ